MNVLEVELEDLIWKNFQSNPHELALRGLYMSGIGFRQLNLGNYGIADIVTVTLIRDYETAKVKKISVEIYELKKDFINNDTFFQALSYKTGIKSIVDKLETMYCYDVEYSITLIGKRMDTNSSFCYLPDFANVRLITYSIDLINGVKFEKQSGFTLTKELLPKHPINYNTVRDLIKKQTFD